MPLTPERRVQQLVPAVNKVLKPFGDKHLRFGYDAAPSPAGDTAPDPPALPGVKTLPGNVGLLTWKKFQDPAILSDAVMAAMKQLASTKALIVDLRTSDGGSPDMVMLLLTCFMPAGDPVLVSETYFRPANFTRQFWTLPLRSGAALHRQEGVHPDQQPHVLGGRRVRRADALHHPPRTQIGRAPRE